MFSSERVRVEREVAGRNGGCTEETRLRKGNDGGDIPAEEARVHEGNDCCMVATGATDVPQVPGGDAPKEVRMSGGRGGVEVLVGATEISCVPGGRGRVEVLVEAAEESSRMGCSLGSGHGGGRGVDMRKGVAGASCATPGATETSVVVKATALSTVPSKRSSFITSRCNESKATKSAVVSPLS